MDCYIPMIVVSLEQLYLLLQLHDFLVNGIILDFCKPLALVKMIILQVTYMPSMALIDPVTHILVAELAI